MQTFSSQIVMVNDRYEQTTARCSCLVFHRYMYSMIDNSCSIKSKYKCEYPVTTD